MIAIKALWNALAGLAASLNDLTGAVRHADGGCASSSPPTAPARSPPAPPARRPAPAATTRPPRQSAVDG
jgi:hypothetical protein